jgi:hypothetical protein
MNIQALGKNKAWRRALLKSINGVDLSFFFYSLLYVTENRCPNTENYGSGA